MYRHLLVPIDGTDLSTEMVGQAVEFARTRTPLGNAPIREYPGVRARVARMDILLQRSRALVHDAARAWETQDQSAMPPLDRVARMNFKTVS